VVDYTKLLDLGELMIPIIIRRLLVGVLLSHGNFLSSTLALTLPHPSPQRDVFSVEGNLRIPRGGVGGRVCASYLCTSSHHLRLNREAKLVGISSVVRCHELMSRAACRARPCLDRLRSETRHQLG
jgi:hypothetical protein